MLPSPKDVEQCLEAAARQGERFDGELVRTVLIADAETGEQEVFALVSRCGGRCLSVGGLEVQLVSAETPAGQAFCGCRPGDLLLLGWVVAVDDSLTQSAEVNRLIQAAQHTQAVQRRDALAEEKHRLAAERDGAKQQAQEAFERRAAAHFERTDAASGQPKRKAKDVQLKWPL